MDIKIIPYTITQTATMLRVNIVGIQKTEATVYYELVRADGRVAEAGNRQVPIAALAIIAQENPDINQMNTILAAFELEADPNQGTVNE